MASAETIPSIRITLTEEEAKAVRDVLYKIGGHEETTRRGLTHRVVEALDSVLPGHKSPSDIRGEIVFT